MAWVVFMKLVMHYMNRDCPTTNMDFRLGESYFLRDS